MQVVIGWNIGDIIVWKKDTNKYLMGGADIHILNRD